MQRKPQLTFRLKKGILYHYIMPWVSTKFRKGCSTSVDRPFKRICAAILACLMILSAWKPVYADAVGTRLPKAGSDYSETETEDSEDEETEEDSEDEAAEEEWTDEDFAGDDWVGDKEAGDDEEEDAEDFEDETDDAEDAEDEEASSEESEEDADDDADEEDFDEEDAAEDDEDEADGKRNLTPWDVRPKKKPGMAKFLPDGSIVNDIPKYFQTDYPDVRYGDGTLATSGCSMTTIASVVSYLTGKDVRPDDLARRFRKADGSHMQRMEAVATIYDLKFTKTLALYDALEAVKQGKLVVVMVGPKSPFTYSQHFILLTGMTAKGRILVHDTAQKKLWNPDMQKGFETGFKKKTLLQGFEGAWIFEPYTPRTVVESRYSGVKLSEDDWDMLAALVWLEARGECFQGQQAVAEVVLNRLISDRFQNSTLKGTILAQGQFRPAKFLKDTVGDELQYKAVQMAMTGESVLPTDVYYFATTPPNGNVWGWVGRHCFCGIPGASLWGSQQKTETEETQ